MPWTKVYQDVVDNMNNRKLKKLNDLSPIQVFSPFNDPKTRRILNVGSTTTPSSVSRIKNNTLKINDLVFINLSKSVNDKGYDIQRGVIKKIKSINKTKIPFTYTLEDLDSKHALPRQYYLNELRKAPSVRKIRKEIDKIYESRRKNKRREYLVSFINSK